MCIVACMIQGKISACNSCLHIFFRCRMYMVCVHSFNLTFPFSRSIQCSNSYECRSVWHNCVIVFFFFPVSAHMSKKQTKYVVGWISTHLNGNTNGGNTHEIYSFSSYCQASPDMRFLQVACHYVSLLIVVNNILYV